MAGSYRHVTHSDGSLMEDLGLIENLGDAHEAIEEMHAMIGWLAGELERRMPSVERLEWIHSAWREGYLRPRVPENAADSRIAGYRAFWRDE